MLVLVELVAPMKKSGKLSRSIEHLMNRCIWMQTSRVSRCDEIVDLNFAQNFQLDCVC